MVYSIIIWDDLLQGRIIYYMLWCTEELSLKPRIPNVSTLLLLVLAFSEGLLPVLPWSWIIIYWLMVSILLQQCSLGVRSHISLAPPTSIWDTLGLSASIVSASDFISIVHTFVCSRIDYCNSLLVGLCKVRLSPLQTVLNACARPIAWFLVSHTSPFFIMLQLHWLPLTACIEFKVLLLVLKCQLGSAPKYLLWSHQIPSLCLLSPPSLFFWGLNLFHRVEMHWRAPLFDLCYYKHYINKYLYSIQRL